jgi:transforming growth factor-beta-induced protein
MSEKLSIVETAVKAGIFHTLVKAVTAAGLVGTLKGAGPFTVFAPNDEAFAKVPADTLNELLKPENKEKLAAVLTYHVVSGKVLAADAAKLTTAATVNGQELKINAANGVRVNDASVITADIEASNGVIHVIDTVLMPAVAASVQ